MKNSPDNRHDSGVDTEEPTAESQNKRKAIESSYLSFAQRSLVSFSDPPLMKIILVLPNDFLQS